MSGSRVSEEESKLFRETVEKIPETGGKMDNKSTNTVREATTKPSNQSGTSQAVFNPPDVQASSKLSFQRNGLQPKQFAKLRKGIFEYVKCELHGLTGEEAKQKVDRLLTQGHRYLLIIHGKGRRSDNGRPVLKNMLNRYLRERKEVLAFHSAQPKDGDTGALYVLTKRSTTN